MGPQVAFKSASQTKPVMPARELAGCPKLRSRNRAMSVWMSVVAAVRLLIDYRPNCGRVSTQARLAP